MVDGLAAADEAALDVGEPNALQRVAEGTTRKRRAALDAGIAHRAGERSVDVEPARDALPGGRERDVGERRIDAALGGQLQRPGRIERHRTGDGKLYSRTCTDLRIDRGAAIAQVALAFELQRRQPGGAGLRRRQSRQVETIAPLGAARRAAQVEVGVERSRKVQVGPHDFRDGKRQRPARRR